MAAWVKLLLLLPKYLLAFRDLLIWLKDYLVERQKEKFKKGIEDGVKKSKLNKDTSDLERTHRKQ